MAARPQPQKAGSSKRPSASACQISSTTLSSARPSACTTRPVISIAARLRAPEARSFAPAREFAREERPERHFGGGHERFTAAPRRHCGRAPRGGIRKPARCGPSARSARCSGRARRGSRTAFRIAIALVERLAGEEHLGHEAREPHAAPDREMDVRRAPPAVGVGNRIGARLDGAKLDATRVVGQEARGAVEVRILRGVVRVVRMDVLARGVAVPDLDHRAGNRRPVLVDDAHPQVDELAERPSCALRGEIGAGGFQPGTMAGGRSAPKARGRAAQRLRRPALRGLGVALDHALALGARVAPRNHVGHIVDTVNHIS